MAALDRKLARRALSLLERHAAWALGGVLLLVYLLSAPAGLTFADASTFASTCATLGLPHPPGYPAWVLSCAPLGLLPFEPFRAATLASSLAAAGSCAVVYVVLRRMDIGLAPSLLAAGALGLAPSFWGQAIIPEVYALNVLLLALSLLLVQQWMRLRSPRLLVLLAGVAGLGLANHWPLFLLSFPALLPWLLRSSRSLFAQLLRPRVAVLCLAALVVGLLPYLLLVLVSEDAFIFAPSYDRSTWFQYLQLDPYRDNTLALAPSAKLAAAAAAAASFLPQYAWLLGLAVLYGLYLMGRREPRLLLGCLWGMLATTALLAWHRPYDPASPYSREVFAVYMLPAYLFAVLPLGLALQDLARRAKRWACWQPPAAVAALLLLMLLHWPLASRRGEDLAGPHARHVIASLPADSLLLTPLGDAGMIYRYADLLAERDDLELRRVLDYVRSRRRYLSSRAVVAKLRAELRPVALTQRFRFDSVGQYFHGTHYVFDPALPAGALRPRLDEGARTRLRALIAARDAGYRDTNAVAFIEQQLLGATETLLLIDAQPGISLGTADRALLDELLATPEGQVAQLKLLSTGADRDRAAAVFAEAEASFSKMRPLLRARAIHMLALGHLNANDLPPARAALERALAELPSVFNSEVLKDLLVVYFKSGDAEAYAALRASYRGLRHRAEVLAVADKWCAKKLERPCR